MILVERFATDHNIASIRINTFATGLIQAAETVSRATINWPPTNWPIAADAGGRGLFFPFSQTATFVISPAPSYARQVPLKMWSFLKYMHAVNVNELSPKMGVE
jgi:hypothetical protein